MMEVGDVIKVEHVNSHEKILNKTRWKILPNNTKLQRNHFIQNQLCITLNAMKKGVSLNAKHVSCNVIEMLLVVIVLIMMKVSEIDAALTQKTK